MRKGLAAVAASLPAVRRSMNATQVLFPQRRVAPAYRMPTSVGAHPLQGAS